MKQIFIILCALFFSLESAIHVIGDSHSQEFLGIKNCIIHYIGPRTMHRIGRDGLSILNFKQFNIQENDTVVLVFGEIDVRCHIGRQRDFYERDLEEVLDTLLENYFKTITMNRSFYNNLNILTYTVTPPVLEAFNVGYESYGIAQDRVSISKLLNQKLIEKSLQAGFGVIDVYNHYADKNGILLPELSDGGLHINSSCNQAIEKSLYKNITCEPHKERFEKIYREKLWGANDENEGYSGGGSLLENARPFYEYLVHFLHANNIKTVVDLGCGDWTLCQHIDWTGIDYTGYDVVGPVIEKNIQKHASDHIHFIHANFLHTEIPKADLLICKHVLQHLPNRDVFYFIKLLPQFKHCLILDAAPAGSENLEGLEMEYFPFWEDRGIDLTLSPFNVEGETVLEFSQGCNASGVDRLTYIHQR